jgi:hypothetical protein
MNRFKLGTAALLLGASALAGVALAQDPYATQDPAPTAQPTPPADPMPPQPTTPVDQTDPAMTGDPAGTGAPVDTMDTTTTVGEATTTPPPVQTAALDLTPRPATQNYPACDPGPGDDSCIQLYERGVRTALASWTQPTGGHGDGAVQTAMGGPEEPSLDAHQPDTMTAESASHAAPAQAPIETATADDPDPAVPTAGSTPAYTGVGGPVAETDYPPCDPGPGDDRCIQLYERGVTGEGN